MFEHGAEQRDFVLAVAVLMLENIRGGMGLQSADADFDSDVADLLLHVGWQGFAFF